MYHQNSRSTILTEKKRQKKSVQNESLAVQIKGIGKKYFIHHEQPTLVENIHRKLKRQNTEEYWALKNVNLSIREGEKIGFYGPNGAGKTTLLKIISGITHPTEGKIETKGKIVSLIDLEAGFHPDLTGQENIFLNGLVVGMSKKEIKEKFAAIVKFADIGNFITAPLYTYSSGMKLRLGFSIAINANPDILVLDEIINVGDKNFSKKSLVKIKQLFKKKKTIILVSHNLKFLKENCERIVYINQPELGKKRSNSNKAHHEENQAKISD